MIKKISGNLPKTPKYFRVSRNMRQYDNIWQYKRQIWFSNTTKYDKYKNMLS